ncbi:hypothetical protein GALL_26460 [mine drainage metagenome]|uniref:Tyr recombinase domain-containing protein n=1 Tax=mine drainage metagenome TaxID=410659 RepID=A0A1J5T7H9_9ZZZZ
MGKVNGNRSDAVSWPTWATERTPLGLQRRKDLFSKFASWMPRYAKDLWVGRPGLELPADTHKKLLGSLLMTSRNANERRILAHWWDALIAAGNQARLWIISFPAREVILPRVTPVFVHRDFQLLQQYRAFQSDLIRLLCKGMDQDKLMDAAFCSAIFFGGVASRERVAALGKLSCADLDGDRSLLWVMLQIPQGNESIRKIRWYPDSLTGALLVRSKDSGLWTGPLQTGKGEDCLNHALSRLGLAPLPHGWSMGDFLRAAQVSLSLDHMGVISAYLSDRFISHSLPDAVLHRIARWQYRDEDDRQPDDDSYPKETGERSAARQPEFTSAVNSKCQREIANKVAEILKHSRQAYGNLESLQKEFGSAMWPITYYLVEWAKWRIRPGRGEKSIQPSSVLRYFRPLIRSLILEAESEDLFSLDVEDFETLYELSTASVKGEGERARVWSTLRSFHDFLFLCGAPDVDFRELDGYTSEQTQGSVSANLITEAEFGQFKRVFFRDEQDGNFSASQRIFFAAMLGYRVGLRRREVQMLLMRDYHPGPEPFLLIRPSKFAKLKSNSSNRRLPLKALLPPDEFAAFIAFMEQRDAVSTGLNAFAFADLNVPEVPPHQARLIDPITEAFQAICGQGRDNFCFHHLRHSFSNWIFLALLSSDQPELLKEHAHFLDSNLLQGEHIQTIRDSLFPRLPGTPTAPDSRHLYQVAALMGHLSPITTLQSYLHLLDWIAMRSLDMVLETALAYLETPDLSKICGLSPSAPYQVPYREVASRPVDFFREFIRARGRYSKEPVKVKIGVIEQLQHVVDALNAPIHPDIRLVITLVARRMKLKDSSWLAKTFGYSAHAIDALYSAYMRLYAKQSVLHPKAKVAQPSIPRTMRDRTEFWRIIEATERAYKKIDNRKSLILAAECLIRRNGPRTGNLYFGKRVDNAPDIVRGIQLMGIRPDDVKLILRQVTPDSAPVDTLSCIIDDIRKSGIAVVPESLDWGIRTKKSDRMRLEIAVYDVDSSAHGRSEGRVRGLNYAAMWILFANLSGLH